MSGTLLSVKEEAREADAAWQAAAALSDLAEALAEEAEAEAAEAQESRATEVPKDAPTGPSNIDGTDRPSEPSEHLDTSVGSKEGQGEDVAVRAAQALGQLGGLMKRRPRAVLKPVEAGTEAIDAIEAAIAAAESQVDKSEADKADKGESDPTVAATATAKGKTTTAAKSKASSKALKDLRAKLEKRREDETKETKETKETNETNETKETEETKETKSEAKELKDTKDMKDTEKKDTKDVKDVKDTKDGSESVAQSVPSVPLAKGTASEQLRAKLLEAKQRLLGANGKASAPAPASSPSAPVASVAALSLTPPPDKKEKKKEKDKEKKKDKKEKKKEKKREREEAVPIRQTTRPMPKQQALPLLCRDEKESKESKEEMDKKIAIEQAKARRLEELREREAQKVQQVHSKAAARKKKEVEDSVRELARKLSQDILEISEIINVENIKEEAVKREGRVGHFGVPGAMANVKSEVKQEAGAGLGLSSTSIADFVKQESVKSEMGSSGSVGLPPGLGPEQRQMIISPEMYAQQMSQLKSMETPEAMALSASSSAATTNFGARLEARVQERVQRVLSSDTFLFKKSKHFRTHDFTHFWNIQAFSATYYS